MDQRTDSGSLADAELRDLIIDDKDGQRFDVSRRIFQDPEVFDLEMERIFETNWVYLAHESQIPDNHDYFTTQIGRQPVVVTRGADGKVHGFINACSHRGAQITTNKRGNKPTFMCPYHGWVYDSTGACVDVNDHANGHYPESFDNLNHDLRKLGQVGVYRGFVFGSIVKAVQLLEEWLGDATVFIDMFVDQSPQGLEVLKGGVHYTTTSNWKLQLENPDSYHFFPVHTGYIALAQKRDQDTKETLKTIDVSQMDELPGAVYDLGNGHGTAWAWMPNGDERPLAYSREFLQESFGEEKANWLIDCVRFQLLFPNLWLMDQSSTTLRIMHPIAVDKTRVEVY
ncbi:MAG: aromatic ring-hydroxylating dioxygenase subunit alpha, partial [Gammaproteobacteria bacterium]